MRSQEIWSASLDEEGRWTEAVRVDGLNLGRVMWATDFPHSDGTYPHSRAVMAQVTAGMSDAERDGVLYRNVAALYGIAA